ncbi:ABC-type transport system involved in cytochrome c biogenesis permease subunit [Nocardioides salarius]|uniref:ABC-type transport system involved in cytochrome c biogenesis permease subunit n=1 Tax=Nocardioides salarius TaxID=374513 RepID=A0ABS2MEB2_9ACTN|nr:cytochrome c biogenesis protein CcsA [Nocardioides salarius]MBM7509533.1 ABC-type transport system involved in cytochrome c biogenesis permease subunit [Nocardioides salarius]
MTTAELAALSDRSVVAAMILLGMALVAFAVNTATSRRSPTAANAVSTTVGPGRSTATQHAGGWVPTPVDAPAARVGTVLLSLGALATGLAVVLRGVAAGRVPWGNMYEFGLTGSAAVALVFLSLLRGRQVVGLAAWVAGLVLVLLGVSVTSFYTPVDDLVPVLNSWWLVVHVAAAITAGALFTVGAIATLAHLLRRRSAAGDDPYAALAHTVHLVAFPIWTFAVIAGAVWAENAWGRYWGWDPKETWAFITWVLYAAHLHALSAAGWRRGAGLLAVAGFLAFAFNFFGVNLWIPGLHSYAGV